MQDEADDVQDVNKDMAIFQLEQSLQTDAESFANVLNEKEDQISRVRVWVVFTSVVRSFCTGKMYLICNLLG